MSANNALGAGVVVLSATADGLVAGMDQAERKVQDFAHDVGKKLDKIGDGKGGGFFKNLFSAGALGAVSGGVAAAVTKGLEVLGGVPDMVRGLAERATGPEAGPLAGIVAGMDRVGAVAEKVGAKLFTALGPAFLTVAEVAESLFDRFGGTIDKVGAALGAAFSVGVEIAGELIGLVAEGIESFLAWATSALGFENTADGAGKVVIEVFRGVGKVAAYVWDTIKAGAGAVAWVAGKIVEGFGAVIGVLSNVVNLAKELPDAIRPEWVDDFAAGVERVATTVSDTGAAMSRWGADAVAGFGDSARRVDAWINGVSANIDRRRNEINSTAAPGTTGADDGPLKLSGAMERGSKEAYSLVTKFQTGNKVAASAEARERAEQTRILRGILRALENAEIIPTV